MLPAQIGEGPVTDTTGLDKTVMALFKVELHPVEFCVNVKLACPAPIPVTKPLLLTVAMDEFNDVHVPPTVGLSWPVWPIQIFGLPSTAITGPLFTVTTEEESDLQPVVELVNTNLAVPKAMADTKPLLFIVATDGLDEVQVPPVEGSNWVVLPRQIEAGPDTLIDGLP